MSSPRTRSVPFVGVPLLLAAVAPLAAQTPLSGNLSGTLAAGVYVVPGTIAVAAGQTLTLSPGVIVKFQQQGGEFDIAGTLLCNGTSGSPVVFTGYADDSAGGDTNGNGPSNASPTAWRGIVFTGAGANGSVLNWTEVRYGGAGFVSNVHCNGANPTLSHCTVRNNYTHGMNLGGNSFPTVHDCVFSNNGGYAVENVPVMALPGFANNSASGNSSNIARVTIGGVTGSLTIAPAQMLGGAVTIDTSVVVPAGSSVTLAAGSIVKWLNGGCELTVDGTLVANGTSGAPVVLTGYADDSAGGDTNNNGASSASPTAWRGIVFGSTSTNCSLTWTDIRYGGSGFISNVHCNQASPTLSHCTLRNNYTHGMNLGANSFPTVHDCVFTNNGGFAVESVPVMALSGFVDNTASGNSANIARVTVGTVSGNLVLGPAQMLGGAMTFDTSIGVPVGASLTFAAGSVVKWANNGCELTVAGTLVANGTNAAPVVLTGYADDSAGGDTNNNGPSAASATAWRGIVFASTSTGCTLNWADIRYGGAGFVSNVHCNAADPTLSHCTLRNNYTHGMNLSANSHPIVQDCMFVNNGGRAVDNVPIDAVPGFTNNSGNGNNGNYLRVTDGNVTGDVRIGSQCALGGALLFAATVHVQPAATLTLEQGLVCKFESGGYEVTVDGSLMALGSGYEPVVLTGYADDDFGGDTNNNGPSTGGATAWRGVVLNSGGGPSLLRNVRIRFGGSGFLPGLSCGNPYAALRSVFVDHCYDRGFVLAAVAGSPTNLVAWGNGGIGIHLTGGSFTLPHATAYANGTGVRGESGWTGTVTNSIVYGNNTNFANLTAPRVAYTDGGFQGQNGNLLADPQFVAPAAGDFHLGANSPCLGVADWYQALLVQSDHDENSRLLDHALTGNPAPDMGAYELPAWDMLVTGQARPGSTLTFTIQGPAGMSFLGLGLLDGASPFLPWGMLLAGQNPGTSVALLYPVSIPVGYPMPLPLVNDPALLAISAGIQTLTLANGPSGLGNFTRLYRMLIRP